MAQSNTPADLLRSIARKTIQDQKGIIQTTNIILVVHDEEDKIEILKKMATPNSDYNRFLHVFNNSYACYEFVIEKVSINPYAKILVFIGSRLASELVSDIHHCEQVRVILVLNDPPLNEKERESMKMYSKVKLVERQKPKEVASSSNQLSDIKAMQDTRFSKSMVFNCVFEKISDKDVFECVNPIERSCKQFDKDFIFRYSMLMCILSASSFVPNKNDLIKLFEEKDFACPENIEKFKETYSPSKALFFYTKDEFIYGKLNNALRTTNICHLLSFQFVFQDICNQLCELMMQEPDDQILTVYRGQQSSRLEVADLFLAYYQHSPIVNTSFFSTSKYQDTSSGFLDGGNVKMFSKDRSLVLFKITARKQDAIHYLPFADISKMSCHPDEGEVLFAPGQMFTINNFAIIPKYDAHIFSFEMSLNNGFNKDFTIVHDKFEKLLNTHMNDPLICLAGLLTDHKRLDEAKELYMRLLSENGDKNKKYACYQGLFIIAMHQNETNEAMIMYRKMTEIKFGTEQLPTNSNDILINETDYTKILTDTQQLLYMDSQMSLDRPLDELLTYSESDEYRDAIGKLPNLHFTLATTFMKNGVYDLAIQIFESVLQAIRLLENVTFDPLLKARCHMQLAHCYYELKLNETALNNYNLALEQDIHLLLGEYIGTLIGIGKVLEITNNYKEALYKYIELAEIYQRNSSIAGLDERHNTEECIQRVISHLITMD